MLESGVTDMSVSIKVSEETAKMIPGKVEQGLYPDLEAAFAEAARLLDEQDYVWDLREKLREAEKEIERREYVLWTPELSEQIVEEAKELRRLGIRPEPDVRRV
jgi:hypothetical protein